MQPSKVLATYLYIQCRRNINKANSNADLEPLFVQNCQTGYNEMCTIIGKLCDKLKLLEKQIYQAIRLIERFCKSKQWLIEFKNYFRVAVICANLLNKYYNDKYLWLHSMQTLTGINEKVLQQCELVFGAAVELDFYYGDQLFQSDKKKISDFLDKYIPRYIKE